MWPFLRKDNPAAEPLPEAAAAPAAGAITEQYRKTGRLSLAQWMTEEGKGIIAAHEAGRAIGQEQVQYMRQTAAANTALQPTPAAKPAAYRPTFQQALKKARTARNKISSLTDADFEALAQHPELIDNWVLQHRVAEFTGTRRAAELGRRYTHIYTPDVPAPELSAEEREVQAIMQEMRAKTRVVTAGNGEKALMRALPHANGYYQSIAAHTPTTAELRAEAEAARYLRAANERARDPKAARAADQEAFKAQLRASDPEHQQKCDHVREVLKSLQNGKSSNIGKRPWLGEGGQ